MRWWAGVQQVPAQHGAQETAAIIMASTHIAGKNSCHSPTCRPSTHSAGMCQRHLPLRHSPAFPTCCPVTHNDGMLQAQLPLAPLPTACLSLPPPLIDSPIHPQPPSTHNVGVLQAQRQAGLPPAVLRKHTPNRQQLHRHTVPCILACGSREEGAQGEGGRGKAGGSGGRKALSRVLKQQVVSRSS